jgi:hypothetical protein
MKLAYPLNGGMPVRTAAWALWLEIHADRYNQDVPATLSSQERARLKARAHSLEPVVRMGHAGITPELVAEVDRALTAHGLIKVGIAGTIGTTAARSVMRSPSAWTALPCIAWERS